MKNDILKFNMQLENKFQFKKHSLLEKFYIKNKSFFIKTKIYSLLIAFPAFFIWIATRDMNAKVMQSDFTNMYFFSFIIPLFIFLASLMYKNLSIKKVEKKKVALEKWIETNTNNETLYKLGLICMLHSEIYSIDSALYYLKCIENKEFSTIYTKKMLNLFAPLELSNDTLIQYLDENESLVNQSVEELEKMYKEKIKALLEKKEGLNTLKDVININKTENKLKLSL